MFDKINRSISSKLLLVVMATTFFALLAYAAAMLVYDIRNFREASVRDLKTQAVIIAEVSAPALDFSDPVAAQENLRLLSTRPIILQAALYTATGERFAEYVNPNAQPHPWPESPPRGATQPLVEGNRIHIWQPVNKDERFLGTVYISERYELFQRLDDSIVILAAVLAASLLLALLIAMWLRRAVTTPIFAVTNVARRVMQSRDFSLRAEKQTDDEIGVLVDAFNDMLGEVERRASALEESNRSLQHEMSEREAAEEALRIADRRKDEFLATLAHELRNPLAALLNGLHILEMSKTMNDARTATEVIARQLKQMVRLVDDLLDVSRITTGKLHINPTVVDARSVMRDAIETTGDFVKSRGHEFMVEMPDEHTYVNADAFRLSQVFSNLLNNAAKYTDPGGRVIFSGTREDGQVVFRVTDTGIGIAPDRMGEVFEMFTQIDQFPDRSFQGLGVGLALSRRLVELHGGDLLVSSEGPGKGSTFTVRLNAAVPPAERLKQPAPEVRDESEGHRVLLVDDNADFVDTLGNLLSSLGHDVRVFHDGQSALDAADEFAPDFGFLDIGMPGMNGYELARELRRIPGTTATILVAATGWGQEKDYEQSRRAGFNHHLVKPVELGDVLAIIEGSQAAEA